MRHAPLDPWNDRESFEMSDLTFYTPRLQASSSRGKTTDFSTFSVDLSTQTVKRGGVGSSRHARRDFILKRGCLNGGSSDFCSFSYHWQTETQTDYSVETKTQTTYSPDGYFEIVKPSSTKPSHQRVRLKSEGKLWALVLQLQAFYIDLL